jgi:hypothetical protein
MDWRFRHQRNREEPGKRRLVEEGLLERLLCELAADEEVDGERAVVGDESPERHARSKARTTAQRQWAERTWHSRPWPSVRGFEVVAWRTFVATTAALVIG